MAQLLRRPEAPGTGTPSPERSGPRRASVPRARLSLGEPLGWEPPGEPVSWGGGRLPCSPAHNKIRARTAGPTPRPTASLLPSTRAESPAAQRRRPSPQAPALAPPFAGPSPPPTSLAACRYQTAAAGICAAARGGGGGHTYARPHPLPLTPVTRLWGPGDRRTRLSQPFKPAVPILGTTSPCSFKVLCLDLPSRPDA